jgi:acyl carrier protein
MNKSEIVIEITRFVAHQANIADAAAIGEELDLFEQGILDSLMAALLVSFCQQRFDCDLIGENISEDEIRTIAGIANVIVRQINSEKYSRAIDC